MIDNGWSLDFFELFENVTGVQIFCDSVEKPQIIWGNFKKLICYNVLYWK